MGWDRVKQFWGKSGDGAQGAEGFANEIGSIDLTENQRLLLKRIGPIRIENQVHLALHVVVVFAPTFAKRIVLAGLFFGLQRNAYKPYDLLAVPAVNHQQSSF